MASETYTMTPKSFKFELGQQVAIFTSKERGKVVGRAEYSRHVEFHYLVEYVNNARIAVSDWIFEDQLVPYDVK